MWIRTQASLPPSVQSSPLSLCQRLQGERWTWRRQGRGGAGPPNCLQEAASADRVFSVSISSCSVMTMPSFPHARVGPGPQKPERPVCRPWPLRGQLKDPWLGHPTRFLTEGALGGSWQSVSVLPFPRPSLHPIFRARGFDVFGFLLSRQVRRFRGMSHCWICGHFRRVARAGWGLLGPLQERDWDPCCRLGYGTQSRRPTPFIWLSRAGSRDICTGLSPLPQDPR